MKHKLLYVFALSVIGLWLELSLIRWLPSQVRALAYFKNLVLISSFLGFGLGFMLHQRARWLTTGFALFVGLEIAVAIALSGYQITAVENPDEHLWLLYWDLPATAPSFPLALAIPVFYVLNTVTFIPIGQQLAAAMQAVHDPLLAYLTNIVGSLIGTLLSVLLAFAELGPYAWFVPIVLVYTALWVKRPLTLAAGVLALLLLALLPLERAETLWSPYYALQVQPSRWFPTPETRATEPGSALPVAPLGYDLSVNGSFHQTVINFSDEARRRSPVVELVYQNYLIPYHHYALKRSSALGEVLIVGAGTGNDVGIALQHGATRIDAVEIDPLIFRLGEQLNPNHVYADPRVQRYTDDARHYLQNTTRKYDLIVFGTLDSQIALSALSTIRLDNYVYTVESLQQVKRTLKPNGMLALYFWAQDWILARLVGTVEQAFGQTPDIVVIDQPLLFNRVVIAPADPAVRSSPESQQLAAFLKQTNRGPQFATDDWPYLYQRERTLSTFYLLEILILAILSFIALRVSLWPRWGADVQAASGFHLPLFLQGMGFLLLETRSISVLSLVFGSTWVVNAIVIASILCVIMLANFAVRVFKLRRLTLPFAGLVITLLVGYVFPTELLLTQEFSLRLASSILIFLSPIFFSSLIFGMLFSRSAEIAWAYGSNLLGAVMGGFGEYAAAITGLSALSLLALAIFVPMLWLGRQTRRGEATTSVS